MRREFREAMGSLRNAKTNQDIEEAKRRITAAKNRMKASLDNIKSKMQVRGSEPAAGLRADLLNPTTSTHIPIALGKILVCPKCFTRNVNWKKLSRKEARRRKTQRTKPYCVKCNTELVNMPREVVNKKQASKILAEV